MACDVQDLYRARERFRHSMADNEGGGGNMICSGLSALGFWVGKCKEGIALVGGICL